MDIQALAVPYEQHEVVKQRGAIWDNSTRRWLKPGHLRDSDFTPWLPPIEPGSLILQKALYLVAQDQACWQCQQTLMVYALACTQIEDTTTGKTRTGFFILSQVSALDPMIAQILQMQFCTYSFDYSTYLKRNVWLNHCLCGAKLDDVRLHNTRGAAFKPRDAAHCQSMKILPLPVALPLRLSADYECKKRLQAYAKTQGIAC